MSRRSSHAWLTFIQYHTAFVMYALLFLMLFSSVALESGYSYLGYLSLYFIALVVSYFILIHFFQPLCLTGVLQLSFRSGFSKNVATTLLICSVLFVLAHFMYLGHVPVITASLEDGYYDIMLIRQSIFFDAPAVCRYIPNFLVKSIFPLLLLYFFLTSRPRFWTTMVVGSFYAVALMNKMFIVLIIMPLSVYFLLERKYFRVVCLSAVPILGLMFIVFAQNPMIRPAVWKDISSRLAGHVPSSSDIESIRNPKLQAEVSRLRAQIVQPHESEALSGSDIASYFQFVDTVYRRVFVIPGQVVSAWFHRIPADVPFAEGCASRPIASIKGCEFINMPRLINDLERPQLAKQGIQGTMTAASFMEDYANYGSTGLILGGVLLGVVLAAIGSIFNASWRWSLVINLIPISLLVELSLTTVLLSGGWLISILLYWIFRGDFESAAGLRGRAGTISS